MNTAHDPEKGVLSLIGDGSRFSEKIMRKESAHDPRSTSNVMKARPCTSTDEMRAALAPIWHYFGQNPPSEDGIRHFLRVLLDTWPESGYQTSRVSDAWHLALTRGIAAGSFLAQYDPDMPQQESAATEKPGARPGS